MREMVSSHLRIGEHLFRNVLISGVTRGEHGRAKTPLQKIGIQVHNSLFFPVCRYSW